MQQQVWRPKLTAFLCISEPLAPPARYLTDMAKGERAENNFGFVKTAGRPAGLVACEQGQTRHEARRVRQASGQRPGLGCTSWAGPEAGASWGRERGAVWGPPGPDTKQLIYCCYQHVRESVLLWSSSYCSLSLKNTSLLSWKPSTQ